MHSNGPNGESLQDLSDSSKDELWLDRPQFATYPAGTWSTEPEIIQYDIEENPGAGCPKISIFQVCKV